MKKEKLVSMVNNGLRIDYKVWVVDEFVSEETFWFDELKDAIEYAINKHTEGFDTYVYIEMRDLTGKIMTVDHMKLLTNKESILI
jgi:hypothetical protein